MFNVFKISEAASLALHSAAYLADNSKRVVQTREIASALDASEAHLAKVLQRLTKAGIVKPVRGPKGGFKIAKPAAKISLLDVYKAIEGSPDVKQCLFDSPICNGNKCILGGLLKNINSQVKQRLAKTKLSTLKNIY
jgi:Rrf2 family protein